MAIEKTAGSSLAIQHFSTLRLQLKPVYSCSIAIRSADDLKAPASWRLHSLSGKLKGFYSLTVNGNWRVIFRFDGSDVELVDYLDYH